MTVENAMKATSEQKQQTPMRLINNWIIKSHRPNISRISNQFRKIELWLTPSKQPWYNYFKKYYQEIPKPFTFREFYKSSKIRKNPQLQFHSIDWSKFKQFQRFDASAQKLLLPLFSLHSYRTSKASRLCETLSKKYL